MNVYKVRRRKGMENNGRDIQSSLVHPRGNIMFVLQLCLMNR